MRWVILLFLLFAACNSLLARENLTATCQQIEQTVNRIEKSVSDLSGIECSSGPTERNRFILGVIQKESDAEQIERLLIREVIPSIIEKQNEKTEEELAISYQLIQQLELIKKEMRPDVVIEFRRLFSLLKSKIAPSSRTFQKRGERRSRIKHAP